MDPLLLASVLSSFALFVLFLGVAVALRARSTEISDRFARLPMPALPTRRGSTRILTGKPGRFSRLLTGGSAPDLATELSRADVDLTPAEYVGLNLITMLIGLGLSFLVFHQSLLLTAAGGLVGLLVPRFYLRHLQRKRLQAFDKQLPDTIMLLSNSLRSGFSLLQAMSTVSQELDPPVSTEFGRVVREVGFGLTLPEALANLLTRIPSDDLDFMITAIHIQYEVGGNLSQLLDSIARTIRERVRLLGDVRVLTSQQRLSAIILSLLPVVASLGIFVMNQAYLAPLWQTACGLQMLAAGILLIIIGYWTVQKVAQIKV